MADAKVRKKLIEQLAALEIDHFVMLMGAVNEIAELRASEVEGRESTLKASRAKGLKLRGDSLSAFDITVKYAEKKVKAPSVKGSRFYLIANDELTVIPRKAKAEQLIRAGANVKPYEDLPPDLKVKADAL